MSDNITGIVPELQNSTPLSPELQAAKDKLFEKLQYQADMDVRPRAPGLVSRRDEILGAGVGLAFIQTPPGQVIPISRHMQKMCDDLQRELGITSFGTYLGHDVDPSLSVDIFVPMIHSNDDSSVGDKVAKWVIEKGRRYGRRYLIWWQRIWNELIIAAWRWMVDRGNNTQNHLDHVHSTNDGPVDPSIFSSEDSELAELNENDRNDLRYAVQAVNELKAFLAKFDEEIPEGGEASFWDGQTQMFNDLRYALQVLKELKAFLGAFDPQGQNDYWRGQEEIKRRLGVNPPPVTTP